MNAVVKLTVLAALVLAIPAEGQTAASHGCRIEDSAPRLWLRGAVYKAASVRPRDAGETRALAAWCEHLADPHGIFGNPRIWIPGDISTGRTLDVGTSWLLGDSRLSAQLSATVDSIETLPDTDRHRIAVFTRYDAIGANGTRTTEARLKIILHYNADTVLFENALATASREMRTLRVGDELYGYVGLARFDSAKADSGRRFTANLRRRFNLSVLPNARPLRYVSTTNESELQKLFGFTFLRDTISALTVRDSHVLFTSDEQQGEAHLHERVHAAISTSARLNEIPQGWEEAFAGYVGGWRGSPWKGFACTNLAVLGRRLPSDPSSLLAVDDEQLRASESVRSVNVARARISAAARAAFLAVLDRRGGDAAIDSIVFAGQRASMEDLRSIAERVTRLESRMFTEAWRTELEDARRSCELPR